VKNSQPLPGLEPPIIQPVAQHCNTRLSTEQKGKIYFFLDFSDFNDSVTTEEVT
jgi:hypothetical protein